jgi:hypothetical protein
MLSDASLATTQMRVVQSEIEATLSDVTLELDVFFKSMVVTTSDFATCGNL